MFIQSWEVKVTPAFEAVVIYYKEENCCNGPNYVVDILFP